MAALEAQVKQLGMQVSQDWEKMEKDKLATLQLLHKVGALRLLKELSAQTELVRSLYTVR